MYVTAYWKTILQVRHKSVNTPLRHKSVNTPLRHKSVNTTLSHELRARSVQQAVRGIKGVNLYPTNGLLYAPGSQFVG